MKKKIAIALSIALAAGVAYQGRTLLKQRQEEIKNAPLPTNALIQVRITDPQEKTIIKTNRFLARIVADKQINLSTKLAGYIKKIYVEEAQKVKKGQKLVQIDESELLSNLQALKATLSMQIADAKVAKSVYERNKQLFAAGGLSKERLDLSKVALEAKEAIVENTKQKIAQLHHQREYLVITAPFDGEIERLLLHEGDLAATGKPIVRMNNAKQKLLFSFAPNRTDITKGLEVLFKNEKIGTVKAIYSSTINGLTTAEVELTKSLPLPNGSQITVDVITAKASGCTVASNAIVHKQNGSYIMLYQDERFKQAKVDIVLENDEDAIVTPCPSAPVAVGNETKLSSLAAYKKVRVIKDGHE